MEDDEYSPRSKEFSSPRESSIGDIPLGYGDSGTGFDLGTVSAEFETPSGIPARFGPGMSGEQGLFDGQEAAQHHFNDGGFGALQPDFLEPLADGSPQIRAVYPTQDEQLVGCDFGLGASELEQDLQGLMEGESPQPRPQIEAHSTVIGGEGHLGSEPPEPDASRPRVPTFAQPLSDETLDYLSGGNLGVMPIAPAAFSNVEGFYERAKRETNSTGLSACEQRSLAPHPPLETIPVGDSGTFQFDDLIQQIM